MAEGIITGANNASAIATVVAAKTLAPLRAETCAWGIATMDYQDEIKEFGSTVNIPIPAEFTTNLMADGGTVTRQANNLGNAALVLNRHRELTWEHTDVNKALATPNLENCSAGQAIANFADSAASTRSPATARLMPAPAAIPLTATTTGASIRARREFAEWR